MAFHNLQNGGGKIVQPPLCENRSLCSMLPLQLTVSSRSDPTVKTEMKNKQGLWACAFDLVYLCSSFQGRAWWECLFPRACKRPPTTAHCKTVSILERSILFTKFLFSFAFTVEPNPGRTVRLFNPRCVKTGVYAACFHCS